MRMLLTGAFVYQEGSFLRCDVALDGQRIQLISPYIPHSDFDFIFHFNNCFISPGFADVHVHLREPGFSYKETIATGTRAAARGGYTAVCTMPNLNPAPDSPAHLKIQQDIIDRDACIAVYPYACITRGECGSQLADIEALSPLVVGFSDDGRGVQDRNLMKEAMYRVKEAGSLIAAHCEDETLLNGGYIHDGIYAQRHGHRGIPSASEYRQLERDLELVRDTKCRYHVCHVSAKESVALIRDAKKDGLPVSCETAPHYLFICDEDICEDGSFKMNPPVRSSADHAALLDGLLDGTIDIIATDHAPHSDEEKGRGLKDSLMGIVGLETAFRVLHTGLVRQKIITLEQLVDKLADAPRRLFGVGTGLSEGEVANMCVIDQNKELTIDTNKFFSMGRSTPFAGADTTGDIVMTISKGEIVWQSSTTEK